MFSLEEDSTFKELFQFRQESRVNVLLQCYSNISVPDVDFLCTIILLRLKGAISEIKVQLILFYCIYCITTLNATFIVTRTYIAVAAYTILKT